MTVPSSRARRREKRRLHVVELFGDQAEAALDLLELAELAWHDCYGEVTPPADVIADILVCAHGTLGGLAIAARLAVQDPRDLRLQADHVRSAGGP